MADPTSEKKEHSFLINLLIRFVKEKPLGTVGGIITLLLLFTGIFADFIAPYGMNEAHTGYFLAPPSETHWLGTDNLGRDILSRVIYGTRISLMVGILVVVATGVFGTLLGTIAGYVRIVDAVIMRLVDIMLCFPTFFLILAVIAFVEDPNIYIIMAVIGVTSWMGICRLVRAEFMALKQRDFMVAAEGLGATPLRIIIRHGMPNALAPVFVAFILGVAGAILTESSLSYLGLGVRPPDPSWGNMLTQGKATIEVAWWLSVFPGCAILVTVLGYNLLGEGLRDVLDPRLRNR